MLPLELRLARERLGLTQTEMAGKLNTSLRGYQHWEGGTRHIPGPVEVAVSCLLEKAEREKGHEKGSGKT